MNNKLESIKGILNNLDLTAEEWSEIATHAIKMANFEQLIPQSEETTTPVEKKSTEVRTSVEKNPDKDDLYTKVTKLVHMIGVPAHIKGYQYLREAIVLVYQDWDYIESVTKKLYPTLAKKFETTPSRVERAIRHAISVADQDIINAHFEFCSKSGNPTNSELIASFADYLKLNA